MNIKYQVLQGTLYLYFNGELDECSCNHIKSILDKIINDNLVVKEVVFNFENLSFMDSTGIGLLLGRYRYLKKVGIPCYIQNPPTTIQKIIEISGLYQLIPKIG